VASRARLRLNHMSLVVSPDVGGRPLLRKWLVRTKGATAMRLATPPISEEAATGPSTSSRSTSPIAAPTAPRRGTIKRVILIALGVLAGMLLAGLGAAYVLFRHDLSEARDRVASVRTEVYGSRYGDIEYRLVGRGPTVLVSHGITGGFDAGMRLTDQWGAFGEGYRFLYVSRFGYLKSSLPEGATARMQAAAYKELLDHLGINRVFLFGNSAGGTAAMWFAIDYPERTNGLILHSSAVPGPEPDRIPKLVAEHDFLYWSAIKVAPDMLIGLLLPDQVREGLTRGQKEFVIENAFMAGLPISERADGVLFDNEVSNPSVNDVPFERIGTPTLIFQAVDDPRELRGGREMARRIRDSEFIGLTGGHFLFGHEKEIQAANAAFISKHANGSR
jgi:pimeloyl-ACP methyl ester carboxylesterase